MKSCKSTQSASYTAPSWIWASNTRRSACEAVFPNCDNPSSCDASVPKCTSNDQLQIIDGHVCDQFEVTCLQISKGLRALLYQLGRAAMRPAGHSTSPKSPLHDGNDSQAAKGRQRRSMLYPRRFAAASAYISNKKFALIAGPVLVCGILGILLSYTWWRRHSSPFGWGVESRLLSSRFGALEWLSGSTQTFEAPQLPPDFEWRAYLKWNPELELENINTQEAAEKHYIREGYMKNLVYKDFELTIRYTACGGLMNQHYCHIAAIALAHLSHAKRMIWPPMQERKSFHIRYHPDARKNEQEWVYLDATTLWNLPQIQESVKDHAADVFGIEVLKHPDHVSMPNMTQLETAFQTYDPSDKSYQSELRFRKPIYLARHNPYMLARAIMDAGRQVVLKHGRQPESVLVDLPCTLFMMDNRNLTIIEDIARLLQFSPRISALADKVVAGIAAESGSSEFNGVHLRMERDAMDWAMILGGRNRYWALYRSSMSMAHFSKNTPLFVASGLLKGSTNINTLDGTTQGDTWSVQQMKQLAREIVQNKLASKVVHKEMYLEQHELTDVSNEQSGLIDLLVLRQSWRLVGISVSTFSFYLGELRLMDGHDQEDTVMLDAYRIGTDELFYSCAIAATRTRLELARQGVLRDGCKRPSGRACWEPIT